MKLNPDGSVKHSMDSDRFAPDEAMIMAEQKMKGEEFDGNFKPEDNNSKWKEGGFEIFDDGTEGDR